MPEVLIDKPTEWLEDHDTLTIDGERYQILTANRHGDVRVAPEDANVKKRDSESMVGFKFRNRDKITEVNISDSDVTLE